MTQKTIDKWLSKRVQCKKDKRFGTVVAISNDLGLRVAILGAGKEVWIGSRAVRLITEEEFSEEYERLYSIEREAT